MIKKIATFLKQLFLGNFDYVFDSISWRLPDWLFYYYHSVLVTAEKPKATAKMPPGYFKRLVAEDDFDLMEKFGFPPELVKARLVSGHRAIIVGKDNEILSILWGAIGKLYEFLSGTILDPGANGFLVCGGYTREDVRGKGLISIAYSELFNSYASEKRNRTYGYINKLNVLSLKVHNRLNFLIVGETVFVTLLGINFCYYKFWPFPTKKFHIYIKRPPDNLGSI